VAAEANKLLFRRFTGRLLESGLLVLAVALGVGATAAGFSLLANTQKVGAAMLASPAYREIVVATQSKSDDMAAPAVVKPAADTAVLTPADLAVSTQVPAVRYAYVSSGTELRFINAKVVAQMGQGGPGGPPGGPEGAGGGQGGGKGNGKGPGGGGTGPGGPPRMPTADELAQKQAEADVFLTDVDQLRGFAVTPAYFNAWGLVAAVGSLFADSESQSDSTLVVLGAKAASQIAGSQIDPQRLVGKKILTMEGYAVVVGILNPSGTDAIDQSFFSPYQTPTGDFAAGGPPRRMGFNVQLRFAVADPAQLEKAEASLTQLLTQDASLGQLVVSNPRAEAQKLLDRNTGIGVLILFLALAALFIASVNVSHILMSRGLRMRRGVGILMALGASRSSLLRLFAGEGVALSTVGSVLGAVLAWPLSQSMQAALGLDGTSPVYLVAGVAGAWVLNLVFSVLPAVQNSQIPPAEAMRAG
jgi:hypothetical protein